MTSKQTIQTIIDDTFLLNSNIASYQAKIHIERQLDITNGREY